MVYEADHGPFFTDGYRTDLDDYDYCGDDYLDYHDDSEPTPVKELELIEQPLLVLAKRASLMRSSVTLRINDLPIIQYVLMPV